MSKNFEFRYPVTPGSSIYKTARSVAVDNYNYERRLNDAKSQIFILQKKYVYNYVKEVKTYGKNLDSSISFDSKSIYDMKRNTLDRARVFKDITREGGVY